MIKMGNIEVITMTLEYWAAVTCKAARVSCNQSQELKITFIVWEKGRDNW